MSKTKSLLTAQHILEKEFRVDTKGYRMTEVDVFLDAVYEDYKFFSDKIAKLEAELSEKVAENETFAKEIEKLQRRVNISEETIDVNQTANVDLLKRLSELEKMVYNSKK